MIYYTTVQYCNVLINHDCSKPVSSIGRRNCEITVKEKTPLSHEVVCFQMLDFETSKPYSDVLKSNMGKLLLSQKLRHFRGSCISQCFIVGAFVLLPGLTPVCGVFFSPGRTCADKNPLVLEKKPPHTGVDPGKLN